MKVSELCNLLGNLDPELEVEALTASSAWSYDEEKGYSEEIEVSSWSSPIGVIVTPGTSLQDVVRIYVQEEDLSL